MMIMIIMMMMVVVVLLSRHQIQGGAENRKPKNLWNFEECSSSKQNKRQETADIPLGSGIPRRAVEGMGML